MGFYEVFDLPTNVRHFYLEILSEEKDNEQDEKNEMIKAWKRTGSVPPVQLAGTRR